MQPDRLRGAGQDAFPQRVVDGTIVLHNLYLMQLFFAYEPHLCKSRVSSITFGPLQSADEDEARQNFCSSPGIQKQTSKVYIVKQFRIS